MFKLQFFFQLSVNNTFSNNIQKNQDQSTQTVELSSNQKPNTESQSLQADDVPIDFEDLFDDSTEELSCCASVRMQEIFAKKSANCQGHVSGKGNNKKSIGKHGKKSFNGKKTGHKGFGKSKKNNITEEEVIEILYYKRKFSSGSL